MSSELENVLQVFPYYVYDSSTQSTVDNHRLMWKKPTPIFVTIKRLDLQQSHKKQ